jgi:hypothetical protein
MFGTAANHLGRFAYTGDRTAFFQKGYCGIMTTNMHELGHLMGFGHSMRGQHDPSGQSEPSDTVSASRGPNYCFNGQKFAPGWTREEEGGQHVVDRPEGYVGRLVAFVDMKVDELLNDDIPFSKSTLQRQANAFVVYNRKKVL